jgi:hypothetical protein
MDSDSLRESNSLKEAFMGVLRDRMIEEMKLRNFSPATQESYAYAVRRLAKYHNKSPDQLMDTAAAQEAFNALTNSLNRVNII